MHLFLFWQYWGDWGEELERPGALGTLTAALGAPGSGGSSVFLLEDMEELLGLLRAGALYFVDSFSDLFWTRKSSCLGIQTLWELRMGSIGHETESCRLKCALPTRRKETFMFPSRLSSQFCHGRKGNWFKTSASLRNKDYMYLAGKTNWIYRLWVEQIRYWIHPGRQCVVGTGTGDGEIYNYYGFHREMRIIHNYIPLKSGYEFKCRKQCSHWAMKTGDFYFLPSFPTLSQFSSVSTFYG